MVRVIKTNRIGDKWHYEVSHLSTDELPTEDVLTGSIAVAADTGDVSIYDEESEEWIWQFSLQD